MDKYDELTEMKIYVKQLEEENQRLKQSNKSLRTNNNGLLQGFNNLNRKLTRVKQELDEMKYSWNMVVADKRIEIMKTRKVLDMKNNLRIICFKSGMMEDYETIRTNAPDEVIKEQLRLNCQKEENGEQIGIDEAYNLLESKGYTVELVDDSSSAYKIPEEADKIFDWYDYYED